MAMNEPFKRPLLMIGVPTNGENSIYFSQSVMGMVYPTNFSMKFIYIPFLEVGRARNILVQMARDMGAKFLLFIDEDVIAEANCTRRLVNHLLVHEDWSCAAGVYATKTHPPEPLLYTEWGQGPAYGWKRGEMVQAKCVGNGYTMMRVADYDLIGEDLAPYYEDRNPFTGQPIVVQNFYKTKTEGLRVDGEATQIWWTEDMYFFHLAEQAGWKIFADTSLDLKHYDKTQRLVFDVPVRDGIATKADPWNITPLICNLGAGLDCNPTEVNVDLRDDPRVFKCDVRQLPANWSDLFDHVKSHHVLEHFSHTQTEATLDEWIRIVKPGGTLELWLPDLQYAAELMRNGALDTNLLGLIYGDQGHEYWEQPPYGGEVNGKFREWSYENNHHRAGFTLPYMSARLEARGLEVVDAQRDGIQFKITVRKPEANHAEEVPGNSSDNETD